MFRYWPQESHCAGRAHGHVIRPTLVDRWPSVRGIREYLASLQTYKGVPGLLVRHPLRGVIRLPRLVGIGRGQYPWTVKEVEAVGPV